MGTGVPSASRPLRLREQGAVTKPKSVPPFSLDGTLRKLGRWMVEREPMAMATAVSLEPSRHLLSDEERSALEWLAAVHLQKHTPHTTDRGPAPVCAMPAHTCPEYGAAHAILRGLAGVRDGRELGHVEELRQALWNAQSALDTLVGEVGAYAQACRKMHRNRWDNLPRTRVFHDHQRVCVLPVQVAQQARLLSRRLATVERVSLLSQYASREAAESQAPGQKKRPILIAAMQDDLAGAGWSLDDIAAMINDGRGGTPKQAKERVRKRVVAPRRGSAKSPGNADTLSSVPRWKVVLLTHFPFVD